MFEHHPRILWRNELATMAATLEPESTVTPVNLDLITTNRLGEVATFTDSSPPSVISISFTGASRSIDAVGISELSQSSDIEIRYKTLSTDATWQTFDAPGAIDTSVAYMKVLDAPVRAETINVRIESDAVTTTLGNVFAGASMLLERPFYDSHSPSQLNSNTEYWFNSPAAAHNVGRLIKSDLKNDQLDVKNITPNWYESNFQPFVEHAKFNPFYYDWSPNQPGSNAGFCIIDGDVEPSRQGQRDFLEIKIDLIRLY